MGLLSSDLQAALLACDRCERVFRRDGALSTERWVEITPHELALHARTYSELAPLAVGGGWRCWIKSGEMRAHWVCPACTEHGDHDPNPPAEGPGDAFGDHALSGSDAT